ncbi:hypothetical protein RJC20_11465, partial [Staphylococcus epidermidis]|nr:hypothetical protein [Staphylococcus epidermidis]
RKVTAQRAENNQKNNKKDNFYIISIEIVFFYLSWDFMSHTHTIEVILLLAIDSMEGHVMMYLIFVDFSISCMKRFAKLKIYSNELIM